MNTVIKKKEGFEGQKAIVIPRTILHSRCVNNPVINSLYITDIGYYPKAKFHYRERPHGADQHILIYCMEGSGSVKMGKTNFPVEPGNFFVVPAKKAHVYASDEEDPWTIYWVHFKGTISNELILQFEKQFQKKPGHILFNEISINLFNEIYRQLERGYGSDTLAYVNMSFWHFLSSFLYNNKCDTNGKLSDKTAIDTAIDFLGSKIDLPLTLEEMAGAVNLSVSYFCFLFKKNTGFPPIEYFNHLKVQKACQYLLFTNLRVKEIAQKLGIEDQYYFSRMFTKVMGMSPNKYKEKRSH
jgi:AraC-like DNA-binding protein